MDPTSAICTPNWPSLAPHDALTRPASQAPLKRAPRIKSGAHHKQGDWRQGARQLPRRSARKMATRPARFYGTARCAAITHGGMRTSKLQRRGIGALNSRTCGGSCGRFTMPLSGWRARPSPPSASSAMGLHNSGATVPGRARRQLRSTLTEPTLHAGHETSISWRGFLFAGTAGSSRALLQSKKLVNWLRWFWTLRRTHSDQSAQLLPPWRLLCPLQLFSCLPRFPG
jgi:hypothetical protein